MEPMAGPSGAGERPDPAPSWTVDERGSFLIGECTMCGHRSPARRARYSVASDMRAHEILCHAAQSVAVADDIEQVLTGLVGPGADAFGASVASGRERLSALGRS